MSILDTYKAGGARNHISAIKNLRSLKGLPNPGLKACRDTLVEAENLGLDLTDDQLHEQATIKTLLSRDIKQHNLSTSQRDRLSLALADHQATPESVQAAYEGGVMLNREQALSRAIDNIFREG